MRSWHICQKRGLLEFCLRFGEGDGFAEGAEFVEVAEDFNADGLVEATYAQGSETAVPDQLFDGGVDGSIVGWVEEHLFGLLPGGGGQGSGAQRTQRLCECSLCRQQ